MPVTEINPFKSVQENANHYFEKSKKAKAKLKGLEKAMQELKEKAGKSIERAGPRAGPEKRRKKEWFEKFRWFFTSENRLLCIAGRDRQSNEQLVKKHLDSKDLYFHADIQGAAHCILKEGLEKSSEKDKEEAAEFAAALSKAWSAQLAGVDVYSVKAEQVSKQAQSGESLGSGAFMIYGEREWFRKARVGFAVGIEENGRVVSGPESAVKANAREFEPVEPSEDPKSTTAKKLKTVLEKKAEVKASLDEIIAALPGSARIRKR